MFWLNFSGFVPSCNVMALFCGEKLCVVAMDVWAKLKNLCIHLVLCEKYSYVIWCVGSWHYVGLFAMMLNCVRYVIFDLALWDFFTIFAGYNI